MFLAFTKYYSVTNILLLTDLPRFDTLETRLSDTYVTFRSRLKTELFKKSCDTWH